MPPAQPKAVQAKAVKTDIESYIPKWAPIAIVILTGILYLPALQNSFTNFDDDFYVLNNPYLRDVSASGIKSIFSSFYVSNYHPLSTLVHLVVYNIFGTEPMPYHLLNVLLHLVNVWLVYKLAEGLSGKRFTASIVALLFGIHPMHVESVAWISELKDVLYAAFYLLSLNVYLRYISSGYRTADYLKVLIFFILSLLSKSAAVTLPVLLIAIDLYKGRAITAKSLLEKAPLFVLSIVFGIVAILSQRAGGSINDFAAYGFVNQIFLFASGLSFYLLKSVAAIGLSAMHYFPPLKNGMLPWIYYTSVPFIGIVSWLIFRPSKHRKELLFGVFFFLIAISVMLQVVSVGSALTAERYTYISYIGLFYAAAQLLSKLGDHKSSSTVISGFSLLLAIFFIQSWVRIPIWQNGYTLFTNVIENYPDNYHGYWMRGNYLKSSGNLQDALTEYNRAEQLDPKFQDVVFNKGIVLFQTGDTKGAILNYNKAIKIDPKMADAYNNRGWSYFTLGDTQAAMSDFTKAISLKADYAQAYNNRGWVYGLTRDTAKAIDDYTKAIAAAPAFEKPYYNRAALLAASGDLTGAIADYNMLLKMNGDNDVVYLRRGQARLTNKDKPGACADWKKSADMGNSAASQLLGQYCR